MTSQDGDDHTRNHGYNTPPEGATDWHLDLNQNFDQIDTDVEIRDTEGNKGDYEPKEGAKYEATDSGAVYYGNGSSWVLADRTVSAINLEKEVTKPVIVGEAFSDRHEYIGYNDLIKAVDEAPQQSEIIIQGNVVVDETIKPEGNYIYLHGYGGNNRANKRGAPSIRASSAFSGNHLFDLSKLGSKWGSIENINLFCGRNVQHGIRTGRSDNGLFSNILLRGPTGIGIKVEGGSFDTVVDRCIIKGVNDSMDTGIYLVEGNEPKIHKSLIRDYSVSGVEINNIGSVGPRIVDTSFRAAGGLYGIYIVDDHRSGNCSFTRCQFEGHNQEDSVCIKAETDGGSTADWWASGCHFNSNNQKAIETSGKVGRYVIGPFNQFGCPIELNGSAGSAGDSVLMFNVWQGDFLNNNRNPGAPLSIIEPNYKLAEFTADSLSFSEANISHDGSGSLVAHDNNNNKIKHKAESFESTGSNGTRSLLGKFDNHPDADTGSTWYITGNGNPNQGFYGMTGDGVIKLH